jgi:NAD(P)H-quinone oxidoreductase subunit 5
MLGNACLRTLQFIRAPSLLHDYHLLENAIGAHLPRSGGPLGRAPIGLRSVLYRFAFNGGYLDATLSDYIVAPFVRICRWCDGWERRWTDFLTGSPSRQSDLVKPHAEAIEDLV